MNRMFAPPLALVWPKLPAGQTNSNKYKNVLRNYIKFRTRKNNNIEKPYQIT